jgi:hypothetical protein
MRSFSIAFILLAVPAILHGEPVPAAIRILHPAPSQQDVPTNTLITFTLHSGAIYPYTVSLGLPNQQAVLGPAACSGNQLTVVCKPPAPLLPNQTYLVTIAYPRTGGISGSVESYSYTFITAAGPDLEPPQLVKIDPEPGTAGVQPGGPFVFRFSKPISSWNIFTSPSQMPDGGERLSDDAMSVELRPGGSYGFAGYLTFELLPAMLVDRSGNAGTGPTTKVSYITARVPGGAPANFVATFPQDGATGVPTNTSVVIRYDRFLLPSGGVKDLQIEDADDPAPQVFVGQLKPNRRYVVTTSDAARDAYGIPLPVVRFSFTTGDGPDNTEAKVILARPMADNAPVNAVIGIWSSVPIASPGTIGAWHLTSINGDVPATTEVSGDGRIVRIIPHQPLTPNTCYGNLSLSLELSRRVDTPSSAFNSGTMCTGASADHDAPALAARMPQSGASAVPLDVMLRFQLNKRLGLPFNSSPLRLTLNGENVAGKITFPDPYFDNSEAATTLIYFIPATNLQPNSTYTVFIDGLADQAGNRLPVESYSFTTGTQVLGNQGGRAISVTPASGSTVQDLMTPIVFLFDSQIGPPYRVTAPVPMTVRLEGATATLTPLGPYPPGQNSLNVYFSPTSLGGRTIQASVTFKTGASSDSTPPRVTELAWENAAASPGLPPGRLIRVTFSKALDPSTVRDTALLCFADGVRYGSIIASRVSEDSRQVYIMGYGSASVYTVIATADLRDTAGNRLVPFRGDLTPDASLDYLSQRVPQRLEILATRPANLESGVSADAPLLWFLSAPAAIETVQQNYLVLADGQSLSGRFELLGGNRVLQFTSDAPLPPGAAITLTWRPADSSYPPLPGVLVRPDNSGPLLATACSPCSSLIPAPSNTFVEISFSRPPSPGQKLVSLWYADQLGILRNEVAVAESTPRDNILRLTPTAPLAKGRYWLRLRGDLRWYGDSGDFRQSLVTWFDVDPAAQPGEGIMAVAPAEGSGEVPTAALIQILFGEPLNPARLESASIELSSNGKRLRFHASAIAQRRALQITPLDYLGRGSTINVSVSGLEDRLGRQIPPKSWTFTTGSFEFCPADTAIKTYSAVRNWNTVAFSSDRQMLPASFGGVVGASARSLAPPAESLATLAEWTPDLKSVIVSLPDARPGHSYRVSAPDPCTLDGACPHPFADAQFVAGFPGQATVTKILGVSPANGQTGVPSNVSLTVQFSQRADLGNLGGIHLEGGGEVIPLVLQGQELTPLGHFARYRPAAIPKDSTTYRLVIDAPALPSGAPSVESFSSTFTTAEFLPESRCDGVYAIPAEAPRNFKPLFRFSRPVNALSLLNNATLSAEGVVDATARLLDDGATILLEPKQLFAPGATAAMSTRSGITDLAGYSCFPTATDANRAAAISDVIDNTPPELIVSPRDGATAVPVQQLVGGLLSEPVPPALPAEFPLRLTTGAVPVQGVFVSRDSRYLFTPVTALNPSSAYQLEVSRLIDFAGNIAPPRTYTFQTAASTAIDFSRLSVLSSSPANGDSGVATTAPIRVNFDSDLNPLCAGPDNSTLVTPSFTYARGSWSVNGSAATLLPNVPLFAATRYLLTIPTGSVPYYGFCNLIGNPLDKALTVSFTTAPDPPSSPPAVLSLSPPPGSDLGQQLSFARITIRFNRKVKVDQDSLYLLFDGVRTLAPPWYDSDDPRVVYVGYSTLPTRKVKLIGTAKIVDEAGNALQPFEIEYISSLGQTPQVSSIQPETAARNVPATTTIRVEFPVPMSQASFTPANFAVAIGGRPIAGSLSFTNVNRTVEFTPADPLPAGATVETLVQQTLLTATGAQLQTPFYAWFVVAGTLAGSSLEVVNTNFTRSGALELQFDRSLAADSVNNNAVWLRQGHTEIPGRPMLEGESTLVFQPSVTLQTGQEYHLTLGPALKDQHGNSAVGQEFRFTAAPPTPAARLLSAHLLEAGSELAVLLEYDANLTLLPSVLPRLLDEHARPVPHKLRRSPDGKRLYLIIDGRQPRPQGIHIEDQNGWHRVQSRSDPQ